MAFTNKFGEGSILKCRGGTQFEDLETQPKWFLRFQRQRLEPCRFQFLPFFYTTRWQLAVFETFEKSLVCYDPVWLMGSPNPPLHGEWATSVTLFRDQSSFSDAAGMACDDIFLGPIPNLPRFQTSLHSFSSP